MFSSWYPITIAGAAHEEGAWPLQISLALKQAPGAWVWLRGPVRALDSTVSCIIEARIGEYFLGRWALQSLGLLETTHTHTHTLIHSLIFMKTQL